MEEEKVKIINKIIVNGNKFFYSKFFLLFLIVEAYIFYKFIDIELFVLIPSNLFIILFWIVKLTYIPKNRTQKFGIIFLINNANYYNKNIDLLFKKIIFMLEEDFKVFVFNKNFIVKLNKKEKEDKIIFNKNYQMLINSFMMEGNERTDKICSLNNKYITFLIPQINDEIINNLKFDLNNGFKKIIKLREKESYNDINTSADIMTISMKYFSSIIYIIFGKIDMAQEVLENIDFSLCPPDDKVVQYLRRNIVVRFIDIYYIKIRIQLQSYRYLIDEIELNNLKFNVDKLETFLQSLENGRNLYVDLWDIKSKMLYAQGNNYDAIHCIHLVRKKMNSNYVVLLSEAFLNINMGKIEDGVKLYQKVSKRKDVEIGIIKECCEFIKNTFENPKYNYEYNYLCMGILTYYWIDKEMGKTLIEKFINNSSNDEWNKYLKIRYLC